MTTVKININEELAVFTRTAVKYVNEGYGGFARAEKDGVITVIPTTSSSDWGEYTAEENAEYLIDQMKKDGFDKAFIIN